MKGYTYSAFARDEEYWLLFASCYDLDVHRARIQSVYRDHRSTETAVVMVLCDISLSFDADDLVTFMTMLDLSSAVAHCTVSTDHFMRPWRLSSCLVLIYTSAAQSSMSVPS
jgi:hypothetical protein